MKKKRIIIPLAVVAALVIAALIYTRPTTLEALTGADFDQCETLQITARMVEDARRFDYYALTLSPGDAGYDALLETLSAHSFQRSLWSLLPRGTWTHPNQEGDFMWELRADCGERIVDLNDFYGKIELRELSADSWYRVEPTGKTAYLESMFDLIAQNPLTEITQES